MFALRWLFGHHFGRKDTTKNAHTQAFGQKNTFFWGRNVQVAEVAEKLSLLPEVTFIELCREDGTSKLTMEDVGLIDSDGSLVLILRQPVTPTYLALTLGDFRVARENGMGSCGPYRVVWADSTQIQLEPNPHWTGEKPIYDMVRCHAG